MGRFENAEIFRDTEVMCRTNPRLCAAIAESCAKQRLIREGDAIGRALVPPSTAVGGGTPTLPARVLVSSRRTFEAASQYARTMKTCVHNFASASNPGGGVVNGSSAQEEALCRCSTLYFNLNIREMWNGFYAPHRAAHDQLHNDDIIYTPNVVVFKSDTAYPKTMPERDWYNVNVITCAAPNLREPTGRLGIAPYQHHGRAVCPKPLISPDRLQSLHERRLRRILDVASADGNEAIILGAFGCGAFRNDPKVVAQAAANVLPDYLKYFKVIEFAVFCRPGDTANYDAFKMMMRDFT